MKQKTIFACQECGAQSQKWLGRCPECDAWNSLVEERPGPAPAAADTSRRYSLAAAAGPQLYADIDTLTTERLWRWYRQGKLSRSRGMVAKRFPTTPTNSDQASR